MCLGAKRLDVFSYSRSGLRSGEIHWRKGLPVEIRTDLVTPPHGRVRPAVNLPSAVYGSIDSVDCIMAATFHDGDSFAIREGFYRLVRRRLMMERTFVRSALLQPVGRFDFCVGAYRQSPLRVH
jgi:hypothetical protein